MKLLGLGDILPAGEVMSITRDGVTCVLKGKTTLLSLAEVESKFFGG
jgi:hypothetical protein